MASRIISELKNHLPFTAAGAAAGIVFMIIFARIPHDTAVSVFYVLHPLHVLLSALVTASMFEFYRCKKKKTIKGYIMIAVIGYTGSIGIATLSDSVIPYLGEMLLDMPEREIHLGFIEKWWLVNPLALAGIAIAFFRPSTKFPHLGHVLLSTWASLFHIMAAVGAPPGVVTYVFIFIFLILAVWLPCCVSDIVFPLAFAGKGAVHKH